MLGKRSPASALPLAAAGLWNSAGLKSLQAQKVLLLCPMKLQPSLAEFSSNKTCPVSFLSLLRKPSLQMSSAHSTPQAVPSSGSTVLKKDYRWEETGGELGWTPPEPSAAGLVLCLLATICTRKNTLGTFQRRSSSMNKPLTPSHPHRLSTVSFRPSLTSK